MSSQLEAVRVHAEHPRRLADFWAALLGAGTVDAAGSVDLLPPEDEGIRLRFVPTDAPKPERNGMHLHLTSASLDDQEQTVRRALTLGARHLDVGQRADEGHVVLADPEGNELCVIEPGNSFLTGCGFLGELACDGTREVGHFWSAALGWPLVWDEDEETAIQSPGGGPKIAWGGPPVRAPQNRGALHLDLAAGDVETEIERLVALGATRRSSWDADGEWVVLLDPDGNELRLRGRR